MKNITDASTFLNRRKHELFLKFSQDYDEEEAVRRAAAQALEDLRALQAGQADPDLLGSYVQHTLTRADELYRPSGEKAFELPLSPAGMSLESTWGGAGWKSPLDFVRGAFGSRAFDDRSIRPIFSMGMPAATGVRTAGDWTSGVTAVDASLNFLWNFYDKMTLFLGPLQKLVERKTGLNIYPDWTENPQDRVTRAMGGVGSAAGIILPSILTKGVALAKVAPVAAVTPAAKVSLAIEKYVAFAPKVFRVGARVAEKAVIKGMRRYGLAGTPEIHAAGVKKGLAAIGPEGVATLGGAQRAEDIVGAFAASALSVGKEIGPKASEAALKKAGKDLFGIMSESLRKILPEMNASALAETLQSAMDPMLKARTFDTLADLATNTIGRVALGMAQGAFMKGTSFAMHGSARTMAEGIAAGVPATHQFELILSGALSSYATGALFSVFGSIPTIKSTDRESLELIGRAIGMSTKDTTAFSLRTLKHIDAVNKGVLSKGAQGQVSLTAAEIVKRSTAARVNIPHEAYTKGGWYFPNLDVVEKTSPDRLLAMARMLHRVIGAKGTPSHGLKAMRDALPTISGQADFTYAQMDVLKKELLLAQDMARRMILRIGIKDSVEDFLGSLPRMIIGSFAMHAREMITDRDMIRDYPEDFINSMLMTAYFLRNPNPGFSRSNNTKRIRNKEMDYDQVKQVLHTTGMVFPELLGDPKMAAMLLRASMPPAVITNQTRAPIIQDLVKEIEQAPNVDDLTGTRVRTKKRTLPSAVLKDDMPFAGVEGGYRDLVNAYISGDQTKIQKALGNWTKVEQRFKTGITADEIRKQAELEKKYVGDKVKASHEYVLEEFWIKGDRSAAQFMDARRRWELTQVVDIVNQSEGLTPGAKFDIEKLSSLQQYHLYKSLMNKYGRDGRLSPDLVYDRLREVAYKHEIPAVYKMLEDFLETSWNRGFSDMDGMRGRGFARITYTEGVHISPELRVAIEVYNQILDRANMIGGPHLGRVVDYYGKMSPEELKKLGVRAGDPRAHEFVVTTVDEVKLLEKVLLGVGKQDLGSFRVLEKVFGELTGKGEAIADPRVLDYFHELAKVGQFYHNDQFFDRPDFYIPLVNPATGDVPKFEGKAMSGITRKKLVGHLIASGLIVRDKETGRLLSVKMPEWGQLSEDIKRYLPGHDKPKEDSLNLRQRQYELTKMLVENLHHFFPGVIKGEGEIKEFTSQQEKMLSRAIEIVSSSGLAMGETQIEAYKIHRIGQRFRQASPEQIDFLVRTEELAAYDWDTGVLRLPQTVRITYKNGRPQIEMVDHSQADGPMVNMLSEQIQTLVKFGIVKDVVVSKELYTTEIGWKHLTAPFRMQAALTGTEIGKVYDLVTKRLTIGPEQDATAVEKMKGWIDEASRSGVKTWKMLELLEKHGIISTVTPEGEYSVLDAKKVLTKAFRDDLRGQQIGGIVKDEKQIAKEAELEAKSIMATFASGEMPVKTDVRMKMAVFVRRLGLSADEIADLTTVVREKKVKTPEEFQVYVREHLHQKYSDIDTENPDLQKFRGYQENLGRMTSRQWQSVYNQVNSARSVPVITFGEEGMVRHDAEGRVVGVATNQFVVKNRVLHGHTLIDRLENELGLEYIGIDGNIITGIQDNLKPGQYLTYRQEPIYMNASRTLKHLDQILSLTHEGTVSKEFGTESLRDTVVPIGFGGHDSAFAVRLPSFSRDPGSSYVKLRESMRVRLDALAKVEERMAKDTASGVNWDRSDLQLKRLIGAIRSMHGSMPDPEDTQFIEGQTFAKVVGLGPAAISRGMHAFMLGDLMGDKHFWNALYNAELEQARLPVGQQSEQMGKLLRMVNKYTKQLSNTSAQAVDEDSWSRAAERANQAEATGPMLDKKYGRFVVVDDSKDWDGIFPVSTRFTQMMSEGYGTNAHEERVWKAHYETREAIFDHKPRDTHRTLFKDSLQGVEGLAEQFNFYGVDGVIPLSIVKILYPEFAKEVALTSGQFYSMEGKDKATVLKVPHKDIRVTQVKSASNAATLTSISQAMELGLDQEAAAAFRDWFTPADWRNDPGLRNLDTVLMVMRKAAYGTSRDHAVANMLIRHLFSGKIGEGALEEPDFDSFVKDWIYGKVTNNPMDPMVRSGVMYQITKKMIREPLLKKINTNARDSTGQIPYREAVDKTQNNPFYLPGSNETGMGTVVEPASARTNTFDTNSRVAYLDSATNRWKQGSPYDSTFWRDLAGEALKGEISTEVKRSLAGMRLSYKDPTALGDMLHRLFEGRVNPLHLKNMQMDSLGTHGRFYQVLDWLFAGTTTDADGRTVLSPSWDYDSGVNMRGKFKAGAIVLGSPYPNVAYDDRMPLVRLGFHSPAAGGVVTVSDFDYKGRAQRDFDIDAFRTYSGPPPAIVDSMVKKAPFPETPYAEAINIENHEHASRVKSFDWGSVSDWVNQQSHGARSKRDIGKVTRYSQAAHHFTVTQQFYGPFVDNKTGEHYVVGPRYRGMEDMERNNAHKIAPSYHQILLDSEGKQMSEFMEKGKWRGEIVNAMFAVYKTDAKGNIDYNSVRNITEADKAAMGFVDAGIRAHNEFVGATGFTGKEGFDAFASKLNEHISRSSNMNRYFFDKAMSNKEMMADLLLGLGLDQGLVFKLVGRKQLDKGENWSAVRKQITDQIYYAERQAGSLAKREGLGETSRERLAKAILGRMKAHSPTELPDNTDMYGHIRVFMDAVSENLGFPDTETLRSLESGMYDKLPTRVEVRKQKMDGIRAALQYEQTASAKPDHAKIRRLAGILDRMENIQQQKVANSETQERSMPPEKRIFTKVGRGKDAEFTPEEVVDRMATRAAIEGMLRASTEGMDEAALLELKTLAERGEAAMAQNWRIAMGRDKKFPTRRAGLQYSLDAMPSEGVAFFKERVEQANANITRELIEKAEARYPGSGQVMALMMYLGKADKVHSFALIGRGDPTAMKSSVPIFRNPRTEVVRFFDRGTINTLSQFKTLIYGAMLEGRSGGEWLDSFSGGSGVNWGTLTGRGESIKWGKTSIQAHISDSMADSLGKGHFDGFEHKMASLVPVKLPSGRVTALPMSNFLRFLEVEKKYTNTSIENFVRLIINSEDPVLDLSGLPKDHPLSKLASFVTKQSKIQWSRDTYEEIRLASQWMRNRSDFSVLGVPRSQFGYSPQPNPGSSGPMPPGAGIGAGLPPPEGTPPGEMLPAKPPGPTPLQSKHFEEIGRLKQKALDSPVMRQIYEGDDFARNLDTFIIKTLMKDPTEVWSLTPADVRTLQKAFILVEKKAKRFLATGKPVTGWVRRSLFNPSALADTNIVTKHVSEDITASDVIRAATTSGHKREVATVLDDVNNLMVTELGTDRIRSKKVITKLARLEQHVGRLNEAIARFAAKGEPTGELKNKLEIAKKRFSDLQEAESGIVGVTADLYNLVENVKGIDPVTGDLVWKDAKFSQITLDKYRPENHAAVLRTVERIRKFTDMVYPVVDEGWATYKELILMRLENSSAAQGLIGAIEERMRLGKVEGYLPRWDPNWMPQLSIAADGNTVDHVYAMLDQIMPMPSGPAKHRVVASEMAQYSKNIVATLMRYSQEAITFRYKNQVELAVQKALVSLRKFQDTKTVGSVELEAYDNLAAYIEDLRQDVLFKRGDTFIDKASRFVRGTQLISKLSLRPSAPARNPGQIFSGMAIFGFKDTLRAVKWAKTEEGARYLGEAIFRGAGPGELADLSIQRQLRAEQGGFYAEVETHLQSLVAKGLVFLQKMPFVGEHAGRELLRTVRIYQMQKHFEQDKFWEMTFRNANFTDALKEAYPMLGRLNVGENWQSQWRTHYDYFTRYLAEREAIKAVDLVHFSYARGARSKLLRDSVGAVLFQLQHWSAKNIEMWHRVLDDAAAAKQITPEWGEFLKSGEAKSLMAIGAWSIIMSGIGAIIPFGLATRYRPDWMQIFGNTASALRDISEDDEDKINRMFFGQGVFNQFAGPAVSDFTMFMNMAFASHIGEPENATKFLLGLRDMRHLDKGQTLHKVARALGPSAVADAIYYDVPKAIRTGGRSMPESVMSQFGLRYRQDEGQVLKMLKEQGWTEW